MAGTSCLKGKLGVAVVVLLILLNASLYFGTNKSVSNQETTKVEIKSSIRPTSNEPLNSTLRNETLESNTDAPQNGTVRIPQTPAIHVDEGVNTASPRNITIVVQLSGEMGNQLSKIAFGRAVQLWAKEDFGIHNTELVFKAQDHSKWRGAMVATKACFPNMRPRDFRAGNTEEVTSAFAAQTEWLGNENASRLSLDTSCVNETCINDSLEYLQTLLKSPPPHDLIQPNAKVSLPLLLAGQFSSSAFVVMDRYYDELQRLFVFDEDACCKERPDPDESVFHFRNFKGEMPRVWNRMGFVELSANKTATEIFGHLKPGEKVAITTRIGGEEAEKYVSALEARGLVVRLVEGQSPLEDFCFLLSAKKELVGMTMSTYAVWAGYLSTAKSVRWYTVDSASRRQRFGERMYATYNWTTPELKQRIHFEHYKTEEAEELDRQAQDESGNVAK